MDGFSFLNVLKGKLSDKTKHDLQANASKQVISFG